MNFWWFHAGFRWQLHLGVWRIQWFFTRSRIPCQQPSGHRSWGLVLIGMQYTSWPLPSTHTCLVMGWNRLGWEHHGEHNGVKSAIWLLTLRILATYLLDLLTGGSLVMLKADLLEIGWASNISSQCYPTAGENPAASNWLFSTSKASWVNVEWMSSIFPGGNHRSPEIISGYGSRSALHIACWEGSLPAVQDGT